MNASLKQLVRLIFITLPLGCLLTNGPNYFSQDFTTALMQSTFQIAGPSQSGKPGEISTGTVFILGKPVAGKPNASLYTLVTAAHVLEGIRGDNATLQLRTRLSDGAYKATPMRIILRNGSIRFYTKHPLADIAVMYVSLPDGVIPKVIGTRSSGR